jgi:putative FmdB family regulatory protein
MPVYDYLCERCGPFTEMRPMAHYELPHGCPVCGFEAPRVILSAPHFSGLSAERRLAHATNERSANAPRSASELRAKHGAGCGCCSGKSSRSLKRDRNGKKSFPYGRPWMISH